MQRILNILKKNKHNCTLMYFKEIGFKNIKPVVQKIHSSMENSFF